MIDPECAEVFCELHKGDDDAKCWGIRGECKRS